MSLYLYLDYSGYHKNLIHCSWVTSQALISNFHGTLSATEKKIASSMCNSDRIKTMQAFAVSLPGVLIVKREKRSERTQLTD